LHGSARFVLQPCDGLADAIEHADTGRTLALCSAFTHAMGRFGSADAAMDTLVLGCTHYPFVEPELRALVGAQTTLLEGGAPVARQTRRLLEKIGAAVVDAAPPGAAMMAPTPVFYSTGKPALLDAALQRWLHLAGATLALDLP
jgi:glutamate racemase